MISRRSVDDDGPSNERPRRIARVDRSVYSGNDTRQTLSRDPRSLAISPHQERLLAVDSDHEAAERAVVDTFATLDGL
jgi:hypothetical protein